MTYPDVRPSASSPSGTAANAASQSVNANKTTESNSQTDLDSLRRQVTDLQNAMAKLISDAGNMAVKSAKEATSDVLNRPGTIALYRKAPVTERPVVLPRVTGGVQCPAHIKSIHRHHHVYCPALTASS